MKVLIVCKSKNGKPMAFISEQVKYLGRKGLEMDYFLIEGKGYLGYLKNILKYRKKVKTYKPNLIHAHYGLSGALAILQRLAPVVITFHNGETLSKTVNFISSVGSLFSKHNIYVAPHIYDKLYFKNKSKSSIIPCGIDLENIKIIPKKEARELMRIPENEFMILFGGAFTNKRKNAQLVFDSLKNINNKEIKVRELRNFNRKEVNNMVNACDIAVLPSFSEGSPQFIKEALAANKPIVASKVGDIEILLKNTEGSFLLEDYEVKTFIQQLNKAIEFTKNNANTNGREEVKKYDNQIIIEDIYRLYEKNKNEQ